MNDLFKKRNSDLAKIDRLRTLETLGSGQGARVLIEGRDFLNLCSNDYLSLAQDSRLKRAVAQAVEQWGAGSGSSRLLSGNLRLHEELEQAAADLVGKPSSLCFSSGYAANIGILSSVACQGDVVFSDRLNHASLIDGCRLSGAKTIVYEHCDPEDLERSLRSHRTRFSNAFVVSESCFSMDGDLAPLAEIAALCEQFDAFLIVDEAHGLGVFGEGRGVCFEQDVTGRTLAVIGAMGKSIGSQGAFVAGSEELRSYLINHARSFIFSTGLSPLAAAAALAGIRILTSEGRERSAALLDLAAQFRQSLMEHRISLPDQSVGPILPILYGNDRRALSAARRLHENGILARAIRPPSVPEGTSRIRCSLTVSHSMDDLSSVVKILEEFR